MKQQIFELQFLNIEPALQYKPLLAHSNWLVSLVKKKWRKSQLIHNRSFWDMDGWKLTVKWLTIDCQYVPNLISAENACSDRRFIITCLAGDYKSIFRHFMFQNNRLSIGFINPLSVRSLFLRMKTSIKYFCSTFIAIGFRFFLSN